MVIPQSSIDEIRDIRYDLEKLQEKLQRQVNFLEEEFESMQEDDNNDFWDDLETVSESLGYLERCVDGLEEFS